MGRVTRICCDAILENASRAAVVFPRMVKALLKKGLALRDRRDEGLLSEHGLAVATGRIQAQMDLLLDGQFSYDPNRRLAKHLKRNRDLVFTYLRHPLLDATNYRAEQALRPAVVNRKVWGGNRTENGARAQGTLTSVIRTARQQGRMVLDFLSGVLRGRPGRRPVLIGGP